MKFRYILGVIFATTFLFSCQPKQDETITKEAATEQNDSFDYLSEQFADIKILRYQIPGFEQLTMQQKNMSTFLDRLAWQEEILCMTKITDIT